MKIVKRYLSPNPYSRSQRKLQNQLAVVIHWTANPGADANQNRNFFENKSNGKTGYGSAHYIVGQNGEVIQCIPETEVAYHCGSSLLDPASGKVYTDLARAKLGEYANDPQFQSPNNCTFGIELCPVDNDGNFTEATLKSAAELCAAILKRYNLTTDDILTHQDIVGWKDCPKNWAKQPEKMADFKARVAEFA